MKKYFYLLITCIFVILMYCEKTYRPGSTNEPVRYIGDFNLDFQLPDGGVRPVVGAQNYQVVRSSRHYPELSDGFGWTYHHHPMLTYWNNKFYALFNSSPRDEEAEKSHVFLCVSNDAKTWSFPEVIFPIVEYRSEPTLCNHRMGFFIAGNGRLLASTAYCPLSEGYPEGDDTNRKYFGVVIREINADGTFGPIYFIAHNKSLFSESEIPFPLYTQSEDKELIQMCEELRSDPLITLHWWEQMLPGNFDFPKRFVDYIDKSGDRKFAKGVSYYHRQDGVIVGLWKLSFSALSHDGGYTWSEPVQLTTLGNGYPKVWGQKTEDGRYAISWVSKDSPARYPMIWATSDDGISFDNMLQLNGEVYNRYPGRSKVVGPCNYQRGIYEGSANVPGTDIWMIYSMSKEDIWVSRIPVPLLGKIDTEVNDQFDDLEINGVVHNWNIYHPKWAPVSIIELSDGNRCLELKDQDPHDYAKAFRVFPETEDGNIQFKVMPKQNDHGRLEIDLLNSGSLSVVKLIFAADGKIRAERMGAVESLMDYQPNRWYDVDVNVQGKNQSYSVSINRGKSTLQNVKFKEYKKRGRTVERLLFRTGTARRIGVDPIDPTTDHPLEKTAAYYIDDVLITQ